MVFLSIQYFVMHIISSFVAGAMENTTALIVQMKLLVTLFGSMTHTSRIILHHP